MPVFTLLEVCTRQSLFLCECSPSSFLYWIVSLLVHAYYVLAFVSFPLPEVEASLKKFFPDSPSTNFSTNGGNITGISFCGELLSEIVFPLAVFSFRLRRFHENDTGV